MSANPFYRNVPDAEAFSRWHGLPLMVGAALEACFWSLWWRGAENCQRSDGDGAALRLRWAARHACRRLRAERDKARKTLESVLASDRRWAAWARDLGTDYESLRDILWPYQEGDASFGWVVERIRDLVRAAAEREKERADRAEAKLDRIRLLQAAIAACANIQCSCSSTCARSQQEIDRVRSIADALLRALDGADCHPSTDQDPKT